MTTYTIATLIGIPVTVLLVFGILIVAARPDREPNGDGVYAAYLGLASIAALYFGLIAAGSLGEAITIFLVGKDPSPGFGNSLLSLSDSQSSGANVVAFAVGTVVAAIVYGFHSRRRHELIESCHDRVLMPVDFRLSRDRVLRHALDRARSLDRGRHQHRDLPRATESRRFRARHRRWHRTQLRLDRARRVLHFPRPVLGYPRAGAGGQRRRTSLAELSEQ